jgi:hypothetical protein
MKAKIIIRIALLLYSLYGMWIVHKYDLMGVPDDRKIEINLFDGLAAIFGIVLECIVGIAIILIIVGAICSTFNWIFSNEVN